MSASVRHLDERRDVRPPPHSIEAEEAVLGAVLIDNSVLLQVADIVSPTDFYRERHRKVFQAMLDLSRREQPIDLVVLADRLLARSELADIGGASYLAELLERVPTAAHAVAYAQIVRKDSDRRRVIGIATDIAREVAENAAPLEEYLTDRVAPLLETLGDGATPSVPALVVETMAKIEARVEGRGPALLSTGLIDLDHLLGGGWVPGNFALVGGRASMGKSSFLDVALLALLQRNIPAGVINAEQEGELCMERLFSKLSGVPVQRIISGRFQSGEARRVNDAAEQVSGYPLFFRDRLSDWVAIQVAVRRMVASGARAVFIDHLHLIEVPGRSNEHERLSLVTRQMARLAKRLQVPLIVAAQINREADRGDRSPRPRMSQLRTCGEADADDVILLYRPGYYDESADRTLCECIVAKQRNGPTGVANLKFHAETGLFTDWFDADQSALF